MIIIKKNRMFIKALIIGFALINAVLGIDRKKWEDQKTKTVWIIIILCVMALLSLYQYMDDKNISDKNNFDNKMQRKNDSINYVNDCKKNESGLRELFFKQQLQSELQTELLKKELHKRDSTILSLNQSFGENPFLTMPSVPKISIYSDSILRTKISLKQTNLLGVINYTSTTICFVVDINDKLNYIGGEIYKNKSISNNDWTTSQDFNIIFPSKNNYIYLCIQISYTDKNNKQQPPCRKIYGFNKDYINKGRDVDIIAEEYQYNKLENYLVEKKYW